MKLIYITIDEKKACKFQVKKTSDYKEFVMELINLSVPSYFSQIFVPVASCKLFSFNLSTSFLFSLVLATNELFGLV